MSEAVAFLAAQKQTTERSLPFIRPVSIQIELRGKHSRRGDLDNIAGSILDALVKSKVISNDNLTCVSELSIKLDYSKIEPSTVITITEA